MMMSFKTAFAAARKAGKKTFTWEGKSYNTKLATGNGTPAKAPVPKGRPVKLPDTAPVPTPRPSAVKAVSVAKKSDSMPKTSPVNFLSDTKKKTVEKEVAKSKEPLLGKRVKYKRASWM